MFKLIKQIVFLHLKQMESQYINQAIQLKNYKTALQATEKYFEKFVRKLKETKAVIFDIRSNIDDVETYICVVDDRDDNLNGSLDIYIMNVEIAISEVWGKFTDMPHMRTDFSPNKIVINELHCDVDGHNYEGKRYARMMVETIKSIALDTKRFEIVGSLSEKDAETQEKKERRNSFYERHGFKLKFNDEKCKSGSFSISLK